MYFLQEKNMCFISEKYTHKRHNWWFNHESYFYLKMWLRDKKTAYFGAFRDPIKKSHVHNCLIFSCKYHTFYRTYRDKIQVWQGCSNEKLSQNSKHFSALRAGNMQNQEKTPFSETPKIYIFGSIWGKIKN